MYMFEIKKWFAANSGRPNRWKECTKEEIKYYRSSIVQELSVKEAEGRDGLVREKWKL